MGKDHNDINVTCSFCGKNQDEVKKLIAGPAVYICDECIDLCNEIVSEDRQQEIDALGDTAVLKPREIKAHLDQYVVGQERLEEKVGQLLEQHRALQEENSRLLARQAAFETERQQFRQEVDRILQKLQVLERRAP